MATFVLIHGAFQGGWVWQRVAAALRAGGHAVYCPTLDGCAERHPAVRPGITLESQSAEIAGLLFFEDLQQVVLAGTSLGGLVVARTAERARQRVAHLVLMDALAPLPGETGSAVNNRPTLNPDALVFGPPPEEAAYLFRDLNAADQQWAAARYTRHPKAIYEDPVDLRQFWSLPWRADVLRCRESRAPAEAHQRRTAERLGARYTELQAGHYFMLSHAAEVARYLVDCAERSLAE